jgi:hypothetical protein
MKISSLLRVVLLIAIVSFLVSQVSVSGGWGIECFALALLAAGVVLLYHMLVQLRGIVSAHRPHTRDFPLKLLATLMGFLFVTGTLLYMYVFQIIENDTVKYGGVGSDVVYANAECLMRSIICSLDLFVLDFDSNVLDLLQKHATLKGYLSIHAVFAFTCTIAMIVGLVYSRLRAFWRLNYGTNVKRNRNHLYLFFGNNEPSRLLIKDVVRNDHKAIAILIDEANLKEDNNNEWDGIIELVVHKKRVFRITEGLGAYVAIASQQLVGIESKIANCPDFDAFGYLGLNKIRALIRQLCQYPGSELRVFFMDDDEDLNIRNIITLAKDNSILCATKNCNVKHTIYCHARYNGPNRVIQDVALSKKLDVKIVDSSHIAVELLKCDREYHPVNVVKVSDEHLTTVKSPLKTMIVGFGEVGRDAFRFLYEFGAFVDSKNINVRSKFECVIVDKKLDDVAGTLKASMPAIFRNGSVNTTISFVNADINGERFNNEVLNDGYLKEINYIIISIGNNDEAIALAARLFSRVRQVRQNISNLRILVRCTDESKVEYIQKVANHYNYGYGNGENNQPVILVFGQPSKTYTYDMVVSDRLIEEGKLFYDKYHLLRGDINETWEQRHERLMGLGLLDIDRLRELRRKESQDKANAFHAGTKMILLNGAMNSIAKRGGGVPDWQSFYNRYFNDDTSPCVEGSRSNIHYQELSELENEMILHLAMLEHIRWNAAHELMGYVFNENENRCDERIMKHNCLCQWNQLDEQSAIVTDWPCDYKNFDFCVIDATIALEREKLLNL